MVRCHVLVSTCYLLTLSNRLFPFLVAFRMYDLDGDGLISRDELLAVLHMMVGANISEDQVLMSIYLLLYLHSRHLPVVMFRTIGMKMTVTNTNNGL